jgi:glutamine amidotransferase
LARPRVAVLDHGMGNLRSVAKALEAAGGDVAVTAEPPEIAVCDALCVPGQGIFGRCIERLRSSGLSEVVRNWIADDRPFFGICLGMQVLFESSDENGACEGLSVLPGTVTRLRGGERVPHIGWNRVGDTFFYFDHSYAARPDDDAIVEGWCHHGERFAAWIRTGSVNAVQFHPEKSARSGIHVLEQWLRAA